jgi:hypothetical protein
MATETNTNNPLNNLVQVYVDFCKEHDIPKMSAHDLYYAICCGDIAVSPHVKIFVSGFISMRDALQELGYDEDYIPAGV